MPIPRPLRRAVTSVVSVAALLIAGLAIVPAAAAADTPPSIVSVGGLTVNSRTNPLGIPGDPPVFGWTSTGSGRDVTQSAYRIQVGTTPGAADLWDSGKVPSADQVSIRYPSAAPALKSATRYYWRVMVWDGHDVASPWSGQAWFETGLLTAGDWNGAQWIGKPASVSSPSRPLVRTEFTTDPNRTIASARIYASARGLYELSLNGQKVGDQFQAPGYTDYRTRIQSQTYDVTVAPGRNAIGAELGDGWYAGSVADHWAVFGPVSDLSVIVKIRIDYTTGDPQWIDSDDSWTWAPGPFEAADRQYGETYNANRLQPGWNQPGFDASGWAPAAVHTSTTSRLVPQPDEPVRVKQEFPAKPTALQPTPGARIFDLGQNISGIYRVKLTGLPGETAKLTFGESVYNSSYPAAQQGKLFTANAVGVDTYTFPSSCTAPCQAVYQPTFTAHGFRYLQVEGLSTLPGDGDVTGLLLASDIPRTGTLQTSNAMLNQLVSNSYWSAIDNMLSIPTDCPQRAERVGYTGDINLFAPTAMYLLDGRSFLSKYADDLADAQNVTDDDMNGSMPSVVPYSNHIPRANGGPSVGWEDAAIGVPYAVWKASGDTSILEDHWSMMTTFLDYSLGFVNAAGVSNRLAYYGDWGSLNGQSTPNDLLATAFTAENLRMMSEMAAAIGSPDADQWAAKLQEVRHGFTTTFVGSDGTVTSDSQTGYALALGMNLVDDASTRDKVGQKFAVRLAADRNHLATGFLGLPWLLPALSSIDRYDLAYGLLLNQDYPSWGFEVASGATTIWEFWNTIAASGQFSTSSQNHYAFGSVTDWMHQNIGGLRIGDAGYKSAIVEPKPGGGITSASDELQTTYGRLANSWSTSASGFDMQVTIPVNTTAEVHLPAYALDAATLDGAAIVSGTPGVHSARFDAGEQAVVLKLGSGSYQLHAAAPPLSITGTSTTLNKPGWVTATATVQNASDAPVTAQLVATAQKPVTAGAPSELTSVPANGTAQLPVELYFDQTVGAVQQKVGLELRSRGDVLARSSVVVTWAPPDLRPATVPPAAYTDWVDFGPSASEVASQNAHGFAKSANAGTSVEAGLGRAYCRRIAGDDWFSAQVKLPAGGGPFSLVIRETAGSTMPKDYQVTLDGVVVKRVRYTPVAGVNTFAIDVTDRTGIDPDGDGIATVRFAFLAGATPPPNLADCSIADLWVTKLLPPADTIPPSVSAAPADDAPLGDGGWYTGPVTVNVTAVDDTKLASVEVDTGQGWAPYSAPLTITADGVTVVRYRAADAAGNVSAEKTLTVRIDATPPVVALAGGPAGDVVLGTVPPAPTCDASDTGSGLRSCEVSGYSTDLGDHTVTATAIDVAGNVATATQTYRVVEPLVEVAAQTRCIGSGAVLEVTTANAADAAVDTVLDTPFGSKSTNDLGAGKSVHHSFVTHLGDLAAGAGTVTAEGEVDGAHVTQQLPVAYDAATCG